QQIGHGCRRERHLLPDVLLDGLQGRNVLGHLVLPRRKLLYAASQGIEAGDRKLLRRNGRRCKDWQFRRHVRQQPTQHRSPRRRHLPGDVTVGLPGERAADTDENRDEKTGEPPEYSPSKRRPRAGWLIALTTEGINGMDRRRTSAGIKSIVQMIPRRLQRRSLSGCLPSLREGTL